MAAIMMIILFCSIVLNLILLLTIFRLLVPVSGYVEELHKNRRILQRILGLKTYKTQED